MDHSTGTLQSADGLELFYQRWHPDGAPRASLAILHGLGGHSGQST
jgi:alpha-beta hydrolase superfamily lysophospholipase